MAAYSYLARDRGGRRIKGIIEADSERAVVSQLRPQGLMVIAIKRKSGLSATLTGKKSTQIRLFGSGVKPKDIIAFARQFATLINAGLPIIRALEITIDQAQSLNLKETANKVKEDLEAGVSLSDALAKHPKVFPSLFQDLTRAGEIGGTLDVILSRLAEYLESTENIKQQMQAAMRYPALVMLMAIGLTGALFMFVLPQMKTLFAEAFQADLPPLTQFMLDLSDFIKGNFYLAPILVVILGLAYHFTKKSDKGSYLLDQIKIKIPVMGKLFHKIALSRFARTLATLSHSGVPILDALEVTGKASENKVIEKALEEARDSLREGKTIAEPMGEYPVFPPIVVSMIAVGEETGVLDEMLNRVADFYDQEVKAMVESLSSLIEPLLIGFLGATIGIVVIAMYLPYFSMFKHVG